MIVHDLDLVCVAIPPDEAQAPLVIDADAVLTRPVANQRLKTVAWRYPQEIQRGGGMELLELPNRNRCDVREPRHTATFEQCVCVSATEGLDHAK